MAETLWHVLLGYLINVTQDNVWHGAGDWARKDRRQILNTLEHLVIYQDVVGGVLERLGQSQQWVGRGPSALQLVPNGA